MDSAIEHAFFETFNEYPTHRVFSPGRVNLIGEHTDYSGGIVFPMALSLGIEGLYRQRRDLKIRLFSTVFPDKGVLEVHPDALSYKKDFSFGNYVQGVLRILKDEGMTITKGYDLYLTSTLPASAGLSSSAALEMAVLTVIESLEGFELNPLYAVKLAKKVENEYIGISSGIMDQFAVKYGKAGHAMFLNTATLEYAYAPFSLKDHVLYLMNTNKKRDLEESDYNERFDSISAGMEQARKTLGVTHSADVSVEAFDRVSSTLESETIKSRLRHVIYENSRTREANTALKALDYQKFGRLMSASHESLKNDLEVSCAELDFLVEENIKGGALGARMTGAGFGGTMIALYEAKDASGKFESLKMRYKAKFNKSLDIYEASSSDGVFWEKV